MKEYIYLNKIKNIAILLFIFVQNSCYNNNSTYLPLHSENHAFVLMDGEISMEKNFETISYYNSIFNDDSLLQIPLMYHIYHKNYEIFIGIPINSNLRSIINYKLSKKYNSMSYFMKENTFLFFKHIINDYIIIEFMYAINLKTLIFISAKCKSTEIAYNIKIHNRIIEIN